LFADDTSFGYAGQDEDQIKYVINHDLHELGDWSKRWLMSFNPDKTEIMLFKYVENSTNFNFHFDGKLIPLASDHKHLGITLSEEANEITLIFQCVILTHSLHLKRQSAVQSQCQFRDTILLVPEN
jgi:hypothetical protein